MKTTMLSLMLGGILLGGAQSGTGVIPTRHVVDGVNYSQEIFFAVLEGLYTDGVSTADAQIFVAIDEKTQHALHFVPGCPICVPAINAIRTYLTRQPFLSKLPTDTFGPGLSETEHEALRAPDLATRVAVIESLMQRWIGQRMDLRRLTKAERTTWAIQLADMRKQGMVTMGTWPQDNPIPLAELGRCALCDGANGAFGEF